MRESITVAAVGDIFLGRRVEQTIRRRGIGYVFELVKPCLRGHDVVVGNLESPISSIEVVNKNRRLIAKPTSLDGLRDAGFKAVSIANNHIMDFGFAGLQDTICELEERNIGYTGAGLTQTDAQAPLRNVGGKSVTLLAYYGGSTVSKRGGPNGGQVSKVLRDIRNARSEADIVLAYLHWGRGDALPMKHQVEFGRQMIDHGANMVIGSGPHRLQPVEQYGEGVIAYSLGNFVFDHHKWQESMILHVSFTDGHLDDVSITPVRISAEHRPEPVDPDGDPETYKAIRSLFIPRLQACESDARLVSTLRRKNLTPLRVLKKVVLSEHRAYPLSFYLAGLRELIKEKWISKS